MRGEATILPVEKQLDPRDRGYVLEEYCVVALSCKYAYIVNLHYHRNNDK
jgi:hypothetical protein